MWLDSLTHYCLRNNIISEDDVAWFRYGIEKRVSTVIVGIPVFTLAIILSNIYTASAFFASFYLLRSRTNGYHAKTIWGCFISSVVCIVLCMYAFYPLLNTKWIILLSVFCAAMIFWLAPYNHPNMNYTDNEYRACKKSSRLRAVGLCLCTIVSCSLGFDRIASGLFLGVAMAVSLLCLAHILNRGENNERKA